MRRLRSSLIAYIGTYGERGVTASDIRLLVLPQGGGYDEEGDADPSVEAVNELNNDLYCLDLSGSITHSLSVRELTDVLFPPRLARTVEVPSLTPNAKFSTIAGAQGRDLPYSGTGPYSHTLDDDWTEAIILLRRLSKYLYGLEYLDLTGCSAWYSVLTYEQDGDRIDWEGHWGKMTTLRLRYGFPISENTPEADREARAKAIAVAEQVEKRIVGKRAGKGRFITVERDDTERHA
ncbi:hypothetical protein HYQ44_001426 [Verticillium longisporum]|nr:hypothetical protein HYQ44_001426 [Verticillium longisporum]